MKIAVLADIHDQMDTLGHFLNLTLVEEAEHLILCGDLTLPRVLERCVRPGRPLSFCLGNCDARHAQALRQTAARLGIAAWGELGELGLPEGGKAAFTHFPALARQAALSGEYRAVFYGHTHRAQVEHLRVKGALVLLANPGDIEGRHGEPGGLLWDTRTDELVEL